MVNPTSPYNFTLQSGTVQAIGQMLEDKQKTEEALEDDDNI